MDGEYANYSTTFYGAQGGMGGGGFTGGEGGSQGGSQSDGRGYMKNSLRPVTIKQTLDATQAHGDADFKIDGTEVSQVTFVGQVRAVSHLTTFVTYKLDDGTGEIEVKLWLEKNAVNPTGDDMDTGDAPRSSESEIPINGYAKVWGKLNNFNNRRNFVAHVIRPITNIDEYNCHFLEATAIHLYYTRGPVGGHLGDEKPLPGATHASGGGPFAGKTLPPMSPLARKMYETLSNTPQSNEGLHVQHLASLMGLPVGEVYKAKEELLSLALIFSTVDDNTLAILEY
ncbi:single-stranded DNA binding protein p30 subunit [Histoplasma capsulatum G186AR]|uniref:Single-stranded DNA binding protein p30 subunit n=1 Tax=Ajellomyces capsulatus TaxID=5037 RepID=A0A8H7YQ36_AJECA|nr:single-stranded DNA binding protein p30 subunit [Histoplasma capsulatum]QSS75540.1 single-stranded DNA binding protein p30 subunit [Histoplasma capsulatum G186AR]